MHTNVRTERLARGMSQQAVAELLGVSDTIVSLWDRGKRQPYARNARKLEALFGKPIAVLMSPASDNGADASSADPEN